LNKEDIEVCMEKKKILWIVIAVIVFLLIIFGTAMILYWPTRSTGQSLQQAATVIPTQGTTGTRTKIDPDTWVRQPGTAPGLDSPSPSKPGDINLTIVNGDNAGANYGTLDVSGLTKHPDTVSTSPSAGTTNQSATGQGTATPALAIPGQSDTSTTVQSSSTTTVATGTAGASTSGGPAVTTTTAVSTTKATVKTGTTASAPVSPSVTTTTKATTKAKTSAAKPAPVPVTEYWIQTGSFSSKLNAEKARDLLIARYLKAEIFTKMAGGKTSYRVRVGSYISKAEADYWLGTIKGIPDFAGSYVSEIKTRK
jgi:cell division septation protein DedD